ncbi:MAG: type II restriction enzyme [Kiritimatiellia bacterium]|jgi:hypothetical protein
MCRQFETKNDKSWNDLFEKYDILQKIDTDGEFTISASKIKEFREPRLMTKFDHEINRPRVFSENDLSILPISRGDYIISQFTAYQPLVALSDPIQQVALPEHLQSLNARAVTSETIAVNCALASGIFSHFLGEEQLDATVSGRMGSGVFDFGIHNLRRGGVSSIRVDNAQIEIDAAFEGIDSLALIEAKRDLSDDFIIRQLYYPYRTWQERVTKKVRPVFFVYSNGVYNLYEYEFQSTDEYNSLVLIKHARYSIEEDMSITLPELQRLAADTSPVDEPKIPFPQADSFERVVNVCELLESQELDRDNITDGYAFDVRQTNYYTDAARYLGLVEKMKIDRTPAYRLSRQGRCVLKLNYKNRQLAFCKCILQHRVFHKVFLLCCEHGEMPSRDTIVQIMKQSQLYKIESDSTYYRRASTVSGWVNWMLKLVSE